MYIRTHVNLVLNTTRDVIVGRDSGGNTHLMDHGNPKFTRETGENTHLVAHGNPKVTENPGNTATLVLTGLLEDLTFHCAAIDGKSVPGRR